MKSKTRYTPETITVYPLDMERLNESINKFFHEDKKFLESTTYHTRGVLALIKQPNLCLITDEFVGWDISDKVTFYVYEEGKRENGGFWFGCIPTHEITMLIKELKPYLKPTITLAEFTKERRGYNARIRANEVDWIRYFNK